MRVQINAHHFELTDKFKDYVTKKVSKLPKYLDVLDEAIVDLSYAKTARSAADRQVAQLTIRGKGIQLRAEERTKDMQVSVDAAMDKIMRQIDRYKGRHWDPRGDGRSAAEVVAGPSESEAEPGEPRIEDRILRRKRFALAPMDEAEAIEQMDLLGHEGFFVYLDGESGRVNVLYRRRDGTYGLIETDVI